MGLYWLYGQRVVTDPRLSLVGDWTYSEIYGYAKELCVGIFLMFAWVSRRDALLGFWAALIIYLLLDDAARFHEHGGAFLSDAFNFQPWLDVGLTRSQIGQGMYSAIAGSIVLTVLIPLWRRASPASRARSRPILALMVALAFFGVGLDLVQTSEGNLLRKFIRTIEEGGELVVVSLLLAYVAAIALTNGTGSDFHGPSSRHTPQSRSQHSANLADLPRRE